MKILEQRAYSVTHYLLLLSSTTRNILARPSKTKTKYTKLVLGSNYSSAKLLTTYKPRRPALTRRVGFVWNFQDWFLEFFPQVYHINSTAALPMALAPSVTAMSLFVNDIKLEVWCWVSLKTISYVGFCSAFHWRRNYASRFCVDLTEINSKTMFLYTYVYTDMNQIFIGVLDTSLLKGIMSFCDIFSARLLLTMTFRFRKPLEDKLSQAPNAMIYYIHTLFHKQYMLPCFISFRNLTFCSWFLSPHLKPYRSNIHTSNRHRIRAYWGRLLTTTWLLFCRHPRWCCFLFVSPVKVSQVRGGRNIARSDVFVPHFDGEGECTTIWERRQIGVWICCTYHCST